MNMAMNRLRRSIRRRRHQSPQPRGQLAVNTPGPTALIFNSVRDPTPERVVVPKDTLEMAVNISGLRRNIKNVAHNYTDAQVKVREATSNDPWGPSSTMMSEIADLTYNVVAFSEIMQMVWKRLNDHGKNWRHVYKSLVLLEYLIKTGSEKVAQQCKENIFAIQTLKDFQYLDDNKDQGINVREKAKALVALLKDDERLRNERVRALKAKERFAQSAAGIGNDTVLQLALAMSREEAEQEESKTKSDDIRLQLALQKSRENDGEKKTLTRPSNDLLDLDFGNPIVENIFPSQPPPPTRTQASLDPWGMPERSGDSTTDSNDDPWGGSQQQQPASDMKALTFSSDNGNNDPWSPVQPPQARLSPMPPGFGNNNGQSVPFASTSPTMLASGDGHGRFPPASAKSPSNNDPWSTVKNDNNGHEPESIDPFSPQAQSQLEEFDMFRSEIETIGPDGGMDSAFGGTESKRGVTSPNPFDMGGLSAELGSSPIPPGTSCSSKATGTKPKIVQSLLGEHSNLVNLDNLVSTINSTTARNPFETNPPNPFQAKVQKPPMNALMQQNYAGSNNWNQHQQSTQQTRDSAFDPFM
ncbi:hypothetical protein TCAL_03061 [Tigriopus californicus]|uniref:ENTH domain-containing protein n=1 Tax=Tigriopus californicus TaxID=6832 RepID=A0A553NTM9_TIGCA|nr:hypothetical protein TCAL_03061 [Tigriopus californicus]|eukprot:TCALIF_03061-PA protein Name:"Similar to Epn1 Epsin-1 (Mus musculus)" AED:0.09 eAED:0.09 QI:563/0.87/0.88/1/0.87/0.88/9/647/583